MSDFCYRGHQLSVEELPLDDIAARFGTPCYVYSRATLERNFNAYRTALADAEQLICYAVKSNANLAVLDVLARLGAGFDIVSGGELERVVRAGGDPARVVFSGVAKSAAEIQRALELAIHCFNIESADELQRLQRLAQAGGHSARISVRVNPDVDALTHPYISTGLYENKFGVDRATALALYREAAQMPAIESIGIACHIGSQLTETRPFVAALEQLLQLVDELAADGINIQHIDMGGGLGVRYRDEQPPSVSDYIAAIRAAIGTRPLRLIFEPGRSIAAAAGVLLTRIDSLKSNGTNRFAIVDAAMNDLLRPALYQAWLDIVPTCRRDTGTAAQCYDVVGPVCETGDFIGKQRSLAVAPGDLLAVMDVGAYGFAMSSNYNSRPRPAEVMVDGHSVQLVRARETIDDVLRGEQRWLK